MAAAVAAVTAAAGVLVKAEESDKSHMHDAERGDMRPLRGSQHCTVPNPA